MAECTSEIGSKLEFHRGLIIKYQQAQSDGDRNTALDNIMFEISKMARRPTISEDVPTKNRALSGDDLNQEFWLGVMLSLRTVKPDIGDPINHVIDIAYKHRSAYTRKVMRKGIVQVCDNCGKSDALRMKDSIAGYQCSRCKSSTSHTEYRYSPLTIAGPDGLELDIYGKDDKLANKLMVKNVVKKLFDDASPRTRFILNMMLDFAQNPTDKPVNYLRDIALALAEDKKNTMDALAKKMPDLVAHVEKHDVKQFDGKTVNMLHNQFKYGKSEISEYMKIRISGPSVSSVAVARSKAAIIEEVVRLCGVSTQEEAIKLLFSEV